MRLRSPRTLLVLPLLVAGLGSTAACSSKHTSRLKCQITPVSAQSQPPAPTPKAALDWFLAHRANDLGIPGDGYHQESGGTGGTVFAHESGRYRVLTADVSKTKAAVWAVEDAVIC